jgi:hypothetical protein
MPPAGLSDLDIAKLAHDAGFQRNPIGKGKFPGASPLLVAIMVCLAESGGNPNAHNTSTDSRGLWQINAPAHPNLARLNLWDPATNARAAYQVSGGGVNWCPWQVYEEACSKDHNGHYRQFADRAGTALNQLLGQGDVGEAREEKLPGEDAVTGACTRSATSPPPSARPVRG